MRLAVSSHPRHARHAIDTGPAALGPLAGSGRSSHRQDGLEQLPRLARRAALRLGSVQRCLQLGPDPRHRRRVSPAFHLLGEGAELRVKALKIEAP